MRAFRRLLALCRGGCDAIAPSLKNPDKSWLLLCMITIFVGCALYGGVVGLWRGWQQAVFTAVKMPLLIFLTCAGNALINGMLAQVLGSGLGFRTSAIAILMSFTIAALVLAALSPVALFILANAPALSSASKGIGHSIVLLTDVAFVAYAGLVANHRLLRLLGHACTNVIAARRVFWSWLAVNLFLGAQVAWVLRPFIGTPGLPVEFLRADPMHGTFYGAVFRAAKSLISHMHNP